MLKVVFIVHRRKGLSREEFSRYWRESHQPICRQIPGLRKYVQNHAQVAPDGTESPYDGFAEMWFEDFEAYEAGLNTPEGEATVADVPNFVEVDSQQVLFVEELEVV